MSHEQFEEAIPLYAVGALDRSERQVIEVHLLGGCASCHAALKSYQSVAGMLPYGLPLKVPRPEVKQRILASLTSAPARSDVQAVKLRQAPSSPGAVARLLELLAGGSPRMFSPATALVTVLLVTITVVSFVYVRSQMAFESDRLDRIQTALQEEQEHLTTAQRQLATQEQELAVLREQVSQRVGDLQQVQALLAAREAEMKELQTQVALQDEGTSGLRKALAQRDELLALFRSAEVKVISLSGAAEAKAASGFILFDTVSRKAFFYAFNMPALPPDKTYQLWAILDKPVSAGVFPADNGRKSRGLIRNLPDSSRISKFAVSVEPLGGRPQPTGAIYLLGQL